MKRLAFILASAIAALLPITASAGPVENLQEILEKCNDQGERGCADALWAFVDVTADDRLSMAELTRFFRIATDAALSDQAKAAAAAGVQADPAMAETDRFMALGGAFLSGPIAAQLVIANYDYDDDGVIAKSELYHDLTGEEFHKLLVQESQKLPQRAGGILMRALQAQQELGLGAPAE
jgi:hypothetical protein